MTADPGLPPPWVERVLDVVAGIPAGRVASYGDVGAVAGVGPRQAGTALSRYGGGVPWWRVLRADGTPAEPLAGEQLRRLRAEGVPTDGGRVDLAAVRWSGAADDAVSDPSG